MDSPMRNFFLFMQEIERNLIMEQDCKYFYSRKSLDPKILTLWYMNTGRKSPRLSEPAHSILFVTGNKSCNYIQSVLNYRITVS